MLRFFERTGTRGYYHPIAQVRGREGGELILQAIRHARESGLTELLVNTRGLSGSSPPTIMERYAFATRWAECAGPALRVAFVMKPAFLDAENIGLVMARNRGACGEAFGSEADAIAWLDSHGTVGFARRVSPDPVSPDA